MDKVSDNLFIGRRVSHRERALIKDNGIVNVLDLTTEFPEVSFLRRSENYLCIPILDTKAPKYHELKTGVDWLCRAVSSGPTYVHCAFGHGRSATFVIAYMMKKDSSLEVDQAVSALKQIRPSIGLTPIQIDILKKYRAEL